jgi:hypothetical protein
MANNQPLNTDISVFNRVRSQRPLPNAGFSVKEVANSMHPLQMSVVGREVLVAATRDNPAETGVVTTSLLLGRDSGLPLVIYYQTALSFADAANDMYAEGEVDFPVKIGQDKFLQPPASAVGEDIQGDLADVPGAPVYAPQ